MIKFLLHQTDQNGLVSHVTKTPHPKKTAGSLFTRVHILIEFSQSKIVSSRFITKHTKTIHQDHYRLRNTIQILLKTRSFFFILLVLFAYSARLRSTNAIEHRHWLLASVSIASVLSEHHLFVHVRHI